MRFIIFLSPLFVRNHLTFSLWSSANSAVSGKEERRPTQMIFLKADNQILACSKIVGCPASRHQAILLNHFPGIAQVPQFSGGLSFALFWE
jgi:hypothetical protein